MGLIYLVPEIIVLLVLIACNSFRIEKLKSKVEIMKENIDHLYDAHGEKED